MNQILKRLTALSVFLLPVCGCQNTAFIGQEESIAIAAQYKPDPSEPVDIHVGYKDRTAIAIPPKQGQSVKRLVSPDRVPKGELLATVSVFQIVRPTDSKHRPLKGSVDIYTGLASGIAATNVTASSDTQKIVNVPTTAVTQGAAPTSPSKGQPAVGTAAVPATSQQVKGSKTTNQLLQRAQDILKTKSPDQQ